MKKRFSDLSIEKKLFLFALFLGFVALFGANPYNHVITSINAKEIAFAAGSKSTKIDPLELADWIIKERADYKLVDVRTEKDFNEYHIPQAENILLTELQNSSLERTEKIVLYSANEMEAAQAWFLLRSKGFKTVYILSGGLEAWKSQILFPRLAISTNPEEVLRSEKIKEISKFFGGVAQIAGKDSLATSVSTTGGAPSEMPKLQAPVAPQQGGGSAAAPKKKKEGC